MQWLFSEMLIAPGAAAMRGIRTALCHWPALIVIVLICKMVSPASAFVEASAATIPKRLHATWMIAQGPTIDPDRTGGPLKRLPPIDPDTQGGAPFAPPPSAPLAPAPSAVPQYRVGGVASNDVLNIRSGPDAGSAIVSTIPPDGSGIRMTGSCAGNWCPIVYRSAQGWVHRRYLTSE
jgi:hypothetical protein